MSAPGMKGLAARIKQSAGVLLFRRAARGLEVLLVHPGGPFWANRDEGAWSIPKGLHEAGEGALAAARRELKEETGAVVSPPFIELGSFRQPSGKVITAFAVEGAFDPAKLTSNSCLVEWPPRSRRMIEAPEVDRAAWFPIEMAARKIIKGQVPILRALAEKIGEAPGSPP